MKKSLAIISLFLLVGCGGGGGGSSSSAAHEELTGTYTMTGLKMVLSNGTIYTERDLYSWSGRADIGPARLYIRFMFNGEITDGEGEYTATWDSPTSGRIGNAPFTLEGGRLTLMVFDVHLFGTVTGDAWFYFQKTSSAYTSAAVEKQNVDGDVLDVWRLLESAMGVNR